MARDRAPDSGAAPCRPAASLRVHAMIPPVPLFVELCCGSAAVTLRLMGGPGARPPVSWQGGKQGYAEAILRVFGLRAGQGADAVLLNDLGPWSLVWSVLCRPGGPAMVADVIRGWAGEDARSLWERLRDEPVPQDGAAAAAAWLCMQSGNFSGKEVGVSAGRFVADSYAEETEAAVARGFGARLRPDVIAGRLARPTEVAAREAARFLVLTAGTHGSAEAGGFKGMHVRRPNVDGYIPSREGVACGTARIRLPGDTLVLAQDAASIDPRAAARWLFLARGAFSGRDPSAGIGHPEGLPASDGFGAVRPAAAMLDTWLAGHLPFGAATSCLDAASVIPERLPEGTVVYIDPDYEGTTGYAHTFPREAVLEAAARWRSAGAVVAVSEAAPLPLPGWHALEITGCRRGQRRTFSRQTSEWLTLSHPPAWTPDVQADMFATEAGCG